MSRNLSGVYTLPAAYEATPGQTILATQHNTPLEDLQADMNVARPIVAGGTGSATVIGGWDAFAAKGTDLASAATLPLETATGPLIDITGTVAVTAVTLTERKLRIARAASAGLVLTASANLIVNGSAAVNYTTVAGDLLIFQGYAGGVVRVWTFAGGNPAVPVVATNAQALAGTSTTLVTAPAALAQERQLNPVPFNLAIVPSVAGNALTVAIKGFDGNDPSPTNPVVIPFRNVTPGSGTPTSLTLTAATSLTISSGSTMGFASGVVGRLWVVGFNDASTFRLGLVNALSGTSIMALRDGIYSSTAEGGAGAADSAQVIYTGAAVAAKAMTVLGYVEATEAAAGTWATAPSLVRVWQPGDPLPGDTVQTKRLYTGAVATGSTAVPHDDTIPQNTEGDQYMSQAITPASGANLLDVTVCANLSNAGNTQVNGALFRDSAANAVAATAQFPQASTRPAPLGISYAAQAASTSSTTFAFRGGSNALVTTFNGASSARLYGGVYNSFLVIKELMA